MEEGCVSPMMEMVPVSKLQFLLRQTFCMSTQLLMVCISLTNHRVYLFAENVARNSDVTKTGVTKLEKLL